MLYPYFGYPILGFDLTADDRSAPDYAADLAGLRVLVGRDEVALFR